MKENNTSQAIWVGVGGFSSFAMSIISVAILSRYFDKAEYGTYRQILYIYNTLLIIFSAGLPNVFSYFLPRFEISQGKEIVSKITKVLLLAGFMFSAFLFSFSGFIATALKNPELSYGLKIFSPVPMLLLPTLGIEGIFSTYKKTVFIAIYNTITRLLMLVCIVLPVIILNGTYIYAIYGWIVVSIISLFIALYFKKIPFKGIKKEKSHLTYKEIFIYCIPLATASFWGIAIKASNEFYISRYFGAETFAVFTNGFVELPFVAMVTMATSTVLMPMFSRMVHNETNVEEIMQLWKSALIKSAMIIYPIVVFFILNAKTVVILLYSKVYLDSTIYFQIAMILNFFNIIIFAPLIFAKGKTKFYSTIHMIFAILSWSLGYLVILIFSSAVAIAVLSVSLGILKVLIALNYSATILNTKLSKLFPTKKIVAIISHALIIGISISILISSAVPSSENILGLLLASFLYASLIIFTGPLVNIHYIKLLKSFVKK